MDASPIIVDLVFEAFGGTTALAEALNGEPITTVHSWKRSGRIPRWRKRQIAAAARERGIALPDGFLVDSEAA